ncbi:MAG TPA: nucleotidyltransferase, partial [Candidatus Portnoybacteria bacterium]|nr:nucleotidyltransferase [Candidatus Portnoybacteria bacterium]
VCSIKNGYLEMIEEMVDVIKNNKKEIVGRNTENKELTFKDDDQVSMNMWGVHNVVFNKLEQKFSDFLKLNQDELKGEFFLPALFADMIKNNEAQFKAIQSSSEWFGVTYKEDAVGVKEKLDKLIQNKIYPKNLFV